MIDNFFLFLVLLLTMIALIFKKARSLQIFEKHKEMLFFLFQISVHIRLCDPAFECKKVLGNPSGDERMPVEVECANLICMCLQW